MSVSENPSVTSDLASHVILVLHITALILPLNVLPPLAVTCVSAPFHITTTLSHRVETQQMQWLANEVMLGFLLTRAVKKNLMYSSIFSHCETTTMRSRGFTERYTVKYRPQNTKVVPLDGRQLRHGRWMRNAMTFAPATFEIQARQGAVPWWSATFVQNYTLTKHWLDCDSTCQESKWQPI